jgi:glycosyltransferase involved in cell wall biosynthesis
VKTPISVLIPTYNEEVNLADCLASVVEWVEEIIVIDSFSTDRTVEIARSFGVQVVTHEFITPAQQKNWALEHLPIQNDWVLFLDADERVPPALRDEIAQTVLQNGNGYDGFWMRYRLMFYGKWIRHCGWYPVWLLRLVRRSKARWEDRAVDEHIILEGKAGYLENDLIHENLKDMTFWIEKHNRYASQNAQIYYDLLQGKSSSGVSANLFGSQAERKRFIKQNIWLYLPGRGLLFFLYLYIFRLGFLDGKHGFIFCMMHGIFQQFITVKLWELKHYKKGTGEGGIALKRE